MTDTEQGGELGGIRRLPVWGYVAIVVAYLAIIQFAGRAFTAGLDVDFAAPHTSEQALRSMVYPIGLSALFVYLVVAILGWWKPVFVDDRPVQRWVRIIPIIMVITILLGVNYGGLADKGLGFTLLLLTAGLVVGFGEEGMFRGLGVVAFRVNGFSEGKVALWTTLIFALAHGTNIFSEGPQAFLQVLITVLAGYFFYLIRRYSGGLVMPAIVHGLWDFSLISSYVVEDKAYPGALLFMLANLVLLVIVLVHRHRIEPTEITPQPAMA
jgi:membrane protease YdiL (CAAX protease family)